MSEKKTVSMIFTHNGRMRCFINKLLVDHGHEDKTHDIDMLEGVDENLELSSVGTSEYLTADSRKTSYDYDSDSDTSIEQGSKGETDPTAEEKLLRALMAAQGQ